MTQTIQTSTTQDAVARYLEGLNGKQVARRLRLSASRICQIHGRVLERLKLRLSSIVR